VVEPVTGICPVPGNNVVLVAPDNAALDVAVVADGGTASCATDLLVTKTVAANGCACQAVGAVICVILPRFIVTRLN
jgi:hypothetical protein